MSEIEELKLTIDAMLAKEKKLQERIKRLEELLKKAEDDAREKDAQHQVCLFSCFVDIVYLSFCLFVFLFFVCLSYYVSARLS